jgi:hypothetical protein
MTLYKIYPRGDGKEVGWGIVPDDYEAAEGEIVTNQNPGGKIFDEAQNTIRKPSEQEDLAEAKSEWKQHIYEAGMVESVRPLMRGDTPNEWQDELFGMLLQAQVSGQPDPRMQQVMQAYQKYNNLADQVQAFTKREGESLENEINRMKSTIKW